MKYLLDVSFEAYGETHIRRNIKDTELGDFIIACCREFDINAKSGDFKVLAVKGCATLEW